MNPSVLENLRYWLQEREGIRKLKEEGAPKPWTQDKILQAYRFCNVRREDDTVTRWLAANWRSKAYWDEPNFAAASIFARTINWPPTLEAIGFPHTWNREEMCAKLDEYQMKNGKTYTAAYFITAGPTGVRKNVWVTGNADSYFWSPPKIDPTSIQRSWENILAGHYPCVGPFIAGQVIADLKYTSHLDKAADWWDWAALGPGSMRGLNRLYERNLKTQIKQEQGLEEMREVAANMREWGWLLHLQDVQNCLCELDKYERVLFGEGKPKSGYPGLPSKELLKLGAV
jgi:hypothetical protein